VAGKTGTVNDHTDVWFIGYTPTYATGVWMGNPERKENLGSGMTGGVGALPYFNAFMGPFLKDKPRETFPSVPPIPSEIRTLMERNKREELEKLEKAAQAAVRSGASATPVTTDTTAATPTGTDSGSNPVITDAKPTGTEAAPPPASRPVAKPPVKEPDPPKSEPEGSRRKGKKGDN
jgi:penicillin-binding protein 1A